VGKSPRLHRLEEIGLDRLYELRDLMRADAGYRVWSPLPHQVPPAGRWWGWLLMAGRGSGKTDGVSAYVANHVRGARCLPGPIPHRIALIAPTIGDAAQTAWHHPSSYRAHDPSGKMRTVAGGTIFEWPNGSEAKLFGCQATEDVERLRAGGSNCLVHAEELAAWRRLDEAWDQMRFGLREGPHPHWVASTTPKVRKMMHTLVARDDVVVTQASTRDNPYLPADTVADLYADYGGTRLGRQELEGELLEKVEGAPWDLDWIETDRITDPDVIGRIRFRRVLVGVDPAGGATEIGIVAAGVIPSCLCGNEAPLPHFGVIGDFTAPGGTTPLEWGRQVGLAFDEAQADRVVCERNYGGDLVRSNLQTARPDLPVEFVTATRGKEVRMEPIAALYEARRVHHLGWFAALEEQMTTWTRDDTQSPDRVDALVWAMAGLSTRSTGIKVSTRSGMLSDRVG